MTQEEIRFITDHGDADIPALLLSASRYPGIDVRTAARCIESRRKLKTKIPMWYAQPALEFPFPLALEQCSSQAAAIYRQRFVREGDTVADLTAGLGVDSFFLSLKAASVICWEHRTDLAQATARNLRLLGAGNITLREGDSRELLNSGGHWDLIYADPDRRSSTGRRIYSIRDCEPDIYEMKEELFRHTDRILVKASPMTDISAVTSMFPEASQVHAVSVDDECKEVLFLLEKDFGGEAVITAADVHIAEGGITESLLQGTAAGERQASCPVFPSSGTSTMTGGFLYEPCRAIVKSGLFKTVGARFGLQKISANVHLYFSRERSAEFPGKVFRIGHVLPFSGKTLGTLRELCPAASVTARDFPLTSEQLRFKAGLKEDGDIHVFAYRTDDGKKFLTVCRKAEEATARPIGNGW